MMIVDDHPVVRDGLRGMFDHEADLNVVAEASSGVEALQRLALLQDELPDVVLMDLRMPGGDGVSAIREIRDRLGSRPRILVLTTYDTNHDIRSAMDAGADGYLLKDARRPALVQAVRCVAAGRPVIAPKAQSVINTPREVALTDRELEVLRVIAAGGTNRAAGIRLFVSEATIKTHLLHIYDKLGVSDRAAAVRVSYERGLL